MNIKQEIKQIYERLAVLEKQLDEEQYDWDNAPVIYTYNAVEYRMGPKAAKEMSWEDAKEWCNSVGGELPDIETMLVCQVLNMHKTGEYWTNVSRGIDNTAWIHRFEWNQSFPIAVGCLRSVIAVRQYRL
jgi:hypothetical protein